MKIFAVLALASLAAFAAENGFTQLFDGKTTNGWQLIKGHGPGYIVKEGVLVCPKEGGGNLFTAKEYKDFVFRFEFKMEPGGNNGVGIRAPLEGDAAYAGMEIQILDHDHAMYKDKLKPTQRHGSVYDVIPATADALKPVGEWNSEEIRVKDGKIKVTLNGKVITEGDLSKVTDEALLKKHPGVRRAQGHIGFLGHGSHVEFRNIRVKEL